MNDCTLILATNLLLRGLRLWFFAAGGVHRPVLQWSGFLTLTISSNRIWNWKFSKKKISLNDSPSKFWKRTLWSILWRVGPICFLAENQWSRTWNHSRKRCAIMVPQEDTFIQVNLWKFQLLFQVHWVLIHFCRALMTFDPSLSTSRFCWSKLEAVPIIRIPSMFKFFAGKGWWGPLDKCSCLI